jgi:hypothetical protein
MEKRAHSRIGHETSDRCVPREKVLALRRENRALRETLAIVSNKPVLRDIERSLHELNRGKRIKLSELAQ